MALNSAGPPFALSENSAHILKKVSFKKAANCSPLPFPLKVKVRPSLPLPAALVQPSPRDRCQLAHVAPSLTVLSVRPSGQRVSRPRGLVSPSHTRSRKGTFLRRPRLGLEDVFPLFCFFFFNLHFFKTFNSNQQSVLFLHRVSSDAASSKRFNTAHVQRTSNVPYYESTETDASTVDSRNASPSACPEMVSLFLFFFARFHRIQSSQLERRASDGTWLVVHGSGSIGRQLAARWGIWRPARTQPGAFLLLCAWRPYRSLPLRCVAMSIDFFCPLLVLQNSLRCCLFR